MTHFEILNRRPIIVCLAGPNGGGKTTFYQAYLSRLGLPFVNADHLAEYLQLDPYQAMGVAQAVRQEFVRQRESFVFETVFSDPVGEKVGILEQAAASGMEVVVCFIGLASAKQSRERVALRVTQGGHDVPDEKLRARYARCLANLDLAVRRLPNVLVYDNSDLNEPYRLAAQFHDGKLLSAIHPRPRWLRKIVPPQK